MKAIWKGNISFALVTIPISVCSATRRDDLSFHYLHKTDMSKVAYKRFCDEENREIPWEEITRGYEYEKGRFVEISEEDFEKADVEFSRTIQILEFVKEEEIDPIYFEKPYYLEPQKGAERAYALMRLSLAQSRRVGIAKVVLKSRQHLAAMKAVGQMITLQILRFAHEIVDPAEVNLPRIDDITPKEMDLAAMLIDTMTEKFDPRKFKDEYRDKLLAVVKQKVDGITSAAPVAARRMKAPETVVDLMEVLKQSLQDKGTPARKPAARLPRKETVAVGNGGSARTRKKAG